MNRNTIIKLKVIIFVFLSVFCFVGQQANPNTPNVIIDRVVIISKGGDDFSVDYIKDKMSLRKGEVFTFIKRQNDMHSLYQTNRFDDVKIEVIETGLNSVAIEVTVLLLPKIKDIIINGNKYSSTDYLLKKLALYNLVNQYRSSLEDGSNFDKLYSYSLVTLDYETIAKDKNVLYNYYLEKGFNDVKVTHVIEKDLKNNSATIIFNIDEGKHSKTDIITFHGNSFYTNKQLVRTMEGRPSMWRYLFGAGYLNDEILAADYQTIERVYIGEGFLDFELLDVKKSYSRDNKFVNLDITIREGRRYEIGKISIVDNKVVPTEELKELLTINEGDYFRSNDINATMNALRHPYGEKGYANLRIIKSEKENNGIIDLTFKFLEGEISTVNDIHIIGNKITRSPVILREMALHPGDISDSSQISISERRLRGLGFFESVSILPVKSEVDTKRNINVKVKERATGSISLGVAASDADQVSINFSLSESNFSWIEPYRGDGQRFQFQASASSQRSSFNIYFTEPWLFNERLSYTFNAFRNQRFLSSYDRTNLGVLNSLRSQVEGTEYWQQTIQYRLEEIIIDDLSDTASPEIRAEETKDFISALKLTFRRNTSNRGNRPTQGNDFSFAIDWQPSFLGSSNDVYSVSATYKHFWQPTERTILRFRSTLSSISSYNDGRVAIYNRYTSGGLNSIRGYDFRDVSPVDVRTEPLGGNSLFSGSLELEFPLVDRQAIAVKGDILPVDKSWIRGVLFTDFGNVWEESYDWQFDNINVTVGIGFRIDIPGFGTMVLDFAKPVDNKLGHTRGGEVHFNFGYNF